MVDTYTTSLRIIQMPTGSNDGTWGVKADAAFAMLEQAIAGAINIDVTGANHVLTTGNNVSDEARNKTISFSGTPGATRTITFPDVPKLTLVINSTDSALILTSGAGDSAALLPDQIAFVQTDGATNTTAFIIQDVTGHGVLPQLYAALAL